MSQNFWYPSDSSSAAATVNQGAPNSDANAWPVKVTDGVDELAVNGDGSINVNISGLANPLPVQDSAAEASLASIDSKLTNPLPVSGPLTDGQLRATPVPISGTVTADQGAPGGSPWPVSAASLPLPSGAATEATLAAFSDKTAGALVSEAFDYQDISYVGVSSRIDQVIYKTGGSGGTVVATLTMGYDGSDRLTSVTRS